MEEEDLGNVKPLGKQNRGGYGHSNKPKVAVKPKSVEVTEVDKVEFNLSINLNPPHSTLFFFF